MNKTYKLLNHTEPLSVEEIKELYSGYWVYVVNAEFSTGRKLMRGIPVVIGECTFDGAEDNVFDQFMAPEYGEHWQLLLFKPEFMSVLEELRAAHA